MFLSFPLPLVPEPFEKGSILNINVCCSQITAPLVGDEVDKQTVKPPLFLPPFLCLTFTLIFHSSSFSATRLTPSVCFLWVCVCVCMCVTQLKAAVLCGARKRLCVLVSFEKQPIPYTGNKLLLMLYPRFIFIFSISCQVLMFLQRRCTWCLMLSFHFHFIALTVLAWELRVNG